MHTRGLVLVLLTCWIAWGACDLQTASKPGRAPGSQVSQIGGAR